MDQQHFVLIRTDASTHATGIVIVVEHQQGVGIDDQYICIESNPV